MNKCLLRFCQNFLESKVLLCHNINTRGVWPCNCNQKWFDKKPQDDSSFIFGVDFEILLIDCRLGWFCNAERADRAWLLLLVTERARGTLSHISPTFLKLQFHISSLSSSDQSRMLARISASSPPGCGRNGSWRDRWPMWGMHQGKLHRLRPLAGNRKASAFTSQGRALQLIRMAWGGKQCVHSAPKFYPAFVE